MFEQLYDYYSLTLNKKEKYFKYLNTIKHLALKANL